MAELTADDQHLVSQLKTIEVFCCGLHCVDLYELLNKNKTLKKLYIENSEFMNP